MNKIGMTNVWVMFVGVAMIMFLTMIYMLYFQVGMIKNNIKEELFYALMNGQTTLSKQELAFTNYTVDRNKLEELLNTWANETIKNKINVNEIRIKNLLTNISNEKLTLKVELQVTFTPIVRISDAITVSIQDEIDLSLLKYK